ncbi:LolA family protein [Natrinema longum]|uniref:Outer membrane lipoprotein carrier protein LolA n=1 Tax=Natrinema longum TaxID=370324 RepID=A0A8A2UA96_9EURY|nr:outer membrane lipoprotein carrier protein LolA [Natrinema longum]MBZ6493835.1 outer membrane lipoprotein carrier protein LolA [Natrinema longum]QSW84828.1 outer membrane lipoprotein carrier protein LolA [Natrinema longum]
MFVGDRDGRSVLSVLALAVVLLTAGCVSVPSAGPDPATLEDEVAAAAPPDEVTATVVSTRTVDGETIRTTEAVWLRADGRSRIETESSGVGTVIVDDETQRWHYDVTHDWVTRLETDPTALSILEGLYVQQQRYLEAYEMTAVEEEAVDGRDTYHVTFDPPANETIERSISVSIEDTEYVIPLATSDVEHAERGADRVEVWYDQETLFPVKQTIEGDGVVLERTYRNLSIDGGIDDERFDFDPAAVGGTETDVESIALPSIDDYETLTAADEAVPFTVAEPPAGALPAGVELDSITGYEFPDENRTQVSLQYRTADDETVSVTTSDGPRRFAVGGEAVPVGTARGTIAETEEGTELQWSCGGSYYSVFVEDSFDDGTAVTVGESLDLDC